MPNPNLHPSRLPALATERQRLRQMQKHKPAEFTQEHQVRLDEATDALILAMACALARMDQKVDAAVTASRRPYGR